MKKSKKYNHLSEEQRGQIRDGLYAGKSASQIAKELGLHHSTIIREVKRNRIAKVPNIRTANPALYCLHYQTCGIQNNICETCKSPYTKIIRTITSVAQNNQFIEEIVSRIAWMLYVNGKNGLMV